MLPCLETSSDASPVPALGLLPTLAAGRRHEELWDVFLAHAHRLRAESSAVLDALDRRLIADGSMREWPVAAVHVWIRQRLERVPSRETLAIADLALEELRRQLEQERTADRLRLAAAELVILVSTASYEAAAGAADVLRSLLPGLPAEQQVGLASPIRHLLDLALDAYIGACRLDDAENVLDARGYTPDDVAEREARSTRAFLHAVRGDAAGAERLLDGLPTVPLDAPPRDGMSARESMARAIVQFDGGEHEHAIALLNEIEPHHLAAPEWPFAAFLTARLLTVIDPITGMEHLHRLLHRTRNAPVSRRLKHVLRAAVADLALAADDVPTAQRMLRDIDAEDHLLRISAARLALITGDPEAARDLANLLTAPDLWPAPRAQALLLLAVHLHRAGHPDEAQAAARRAIAITSELRRRTFPSLVPHSDLLEIIGSTTTGLPTDPSAPRHLDTVLARIQLTGRESALLARLESGATLTSIAQSEFVALSTVKSQLRALYRKLGVASREDAVLCARRRGLLPLRTS